VRDLRRAIRNTGGTQSAAGVVKELESILAVVPSGDGDAAEDAPASPARTSSTSFATGLAAGLGQMRDALSQRARSRFSDTTAAQPPQQAPHQQLVLAPEVLAAAAAADACGAAAGVDTSSKPPAAEAAAKPAAQQ
jgi:hypothetical protein